MILVWFQHIQCVDDHGRMDVILALAKSTVEQADICGLPHVILSLQLKHFAKVFSQTWGLRVRELKLLHNHEIPDL